MGTRKRLTGRRREQLGGHWTQQHIGPEEIKRVCEELQSMWSDSERRRRHVGPADQPPPIIPTYRLAIGRDGELFAEGVE